MDNISKIEAYSRIYGLQELGLIYLRKTLNGEEVDVVDLILKEIDRLKEEVGYENS